MSLLPRTGDWRSTQMNIESDDRFCALAARVWVLAAWLGVSAKKMKIIVD